MIVVTGATGQLGRHVVRQLLEKVPATEIAVAVRNPGKAEGYAAQGITVLEADYTKPATFETALANADKVLLISSSEVGQRAAQHRAVVEAAKKAGVKHLVYTGILHSETSTMVLAREHQETEALIRESGLPYTFLRNGWYTENYTDHVAGALAQGAVYGAAGQGRIDAASRADFAAAAVAVLTTAGHDNRSYELAGAPGFTLAEYAAEVARASGKPVVYTNLPVDGFAAALIQAGLPEGFAKILADCDAGIERGELADTSGDLARLVGRPSTPWQETVAAALRAPA